MSVADLSGGVSRSGRIRKKSYKLMEQEETDKTSEVNGYTSSKKSRNNSSNSSNLNDTSFLNGSTSTPEPFKSKKLKIKISLDNGGIEEFPIDNQIRQIDLDESSYTPLISKIKSEQPTVPSLKIKLFQNSSDNYTVTSPPPTKKKVTLTKKAIQADHENAADLLFQQITSGHAAAESSKRKAKKKSFSDYEENVLFEPYESSDDEEASLVISDSSESLQATIEQAKAIKNPTKRRLTETKIETTKSGQVRLKKVDKADKKQKLSKITAYTLFARENRSRIQQSYPHLDFANVSKRLGEVWQALPQREKMQWKRKAQKQKGLNTVSHQTSSYASNKPKQTTPMVSTAKAQAAALTKFVSVRHNPSNSINHRSRAQIAQLDVNLHSKTELISDQKITNCLFEQSKQITTNSIDIASCLKILGDSFNAISAKLNSRPDGESELLNQSEALDLLLDSAVCAMSPLICLTKHLTLEFSSGCSEKVQKQLLNNVAFIMPGI